MEAGYARVGIGAKAERTEAEKRPLIVVFLQGPALDRGVSGKLDSLNQRLDDGCAGGIVRFSLGSDGD